MHYYRKYIEHISRYWAYIVVILIKNLPLKFSVFHLFGGQVLSHKMISFTIRKAQSIKEIFGYEFGNISNFNQTQNAFNKQIKPNKNLFSNKYKHM